jgi:hypothetical protein
LQNFGLNCSISLASSGIERHKPKDLSPVFTGFIHIAQSLEEVVELDVGETLRGKAEAEGFEASVEVLAPTTV